MNLKTALAVALAAAFAAPVSAQQAPRSYDSKDSNPATAGASAGGFAAMDRNNDGRVSRSEFEALQGAAGATVDKDQKQ